MQPRIVVPGDDDAETVFAALIDYQVGILQRMRLSGVVDTHILQAAKRAGELSLALGEDLQASGIRKLFGEMPDDLSGMDTENGE